MLLQLVTGTPRLLLLLSHGRPVRGGGIVVGSDVVGDADPTLQYVTGLQCEAFCAVRSRRRRGSRDRWVC